MKRFIKVVCVLIAVVCFLSVPVYADECSAYSSAYFSAYDSSIDNPSGKTLRIWFDVIGKGEMDEIGAESIVLQHSSNGRDWTTIKTFLPEDYPNMICRNTAFAYDYVTYEGTYGRYYRAYVTLYAKKGNGEGYMYDWAETHFLWIT